MKYVFSIISLTLTFALLLLISESCTSFEIQSKNFRAEKSLELKSQENPENKQKLINIKVSKNIINTNRIKNNQDKEDEPKQTGNIKNTTNLVIEGIKFISIN